MVQSRSSRLRFLRRKQRLEPLPLRVCMFFSFHTDECTPPVRVCKHALVLVASAHTVSAPAVVPAVYCIVACPLPSVVPLAALSDAPLVLVDSVNVTVSPG